VTPLQLAQAYAVLASDGIRRSITFLHDVRVAEERRVMPAAIAREVRSMLEQAVGPGGTAPEARVPGYRVAGKTGTVRKSEPGGYSDSKYLSVFAGMAPASDPRLVMVVMVDEPGAGKYYGGQVAAPVFSRVMAGALRLLAVPPDDVPLLQTRRKDAEEPA
ncbi:MAG TPA: penicillin-binding transpeptidase domain-containing protein, partial [Gammaproteobacteria bacterium]|nr:penicillin-binding transpeptidase domain-containing protein [Gammaproteobacteria bacterium]